MAKVNKTNEIIKERKRWTFFGIPWTFTTYTLTDKKLIIKEGLFSTSEDEVLLYRIIDLSKKRGFAQKLFGLGTLKVFSSDKSSPEMELKNIRHLNEFYTFLSENVEKERLRVKFRAGEIIDGNSETDDFCDHEGFMI